MSKPWTTAIEQVAAALHMNLVVHVVETGNGLAYYVAKEERPDAWTSLCTPMPKKQFLGWVQGFAAGVQEASA